MSKEGVYSFLKANKGKMYTSRQLSENLGIGMQATAKNLRSLMKEYKTEVLFCMKKTTLRNAPVAHYFYRNKEE